MFLSSRSNRKDRLKVRWMTIPHPVTPAERGDNLHQRFGPTTCPCLRSTTLQILKIRKYEVKELERKTMRWGTRDPALVRIRRPQQLRLAEADSASFPRV